MNTKLYGGIEFGGSKTICAISDGTDNLLAQITIPTTTVEETLTNIFAFFETNQHISVVGVGAFGPLNLDTSSSEYGSIYNTPKPGWVNVSLKKLLEQGLHIPIVIDLDVNCAALGELYFGGVNTKNFAYLTLGTGIGGSLIIKGELYRGFRNLEIGHIRIPHNQYMNGFEGACPFHKDCFEGIASGYAIKAQHGKNPEDISDENVWNKEAELIAVGLSNIILSIGPEKIILGGGLMNHSGLIENIRSKIPSLIDGYITLPNLENYIVKSSGTLNGVLGAIKLAAFK